MRDWLERFVEDGTIGESQLEEARSMAANLGIPCEDWATFRRRTSEELRPKSLATSTSSWKGDRFPTQ
jgi:hypothetical protein